MSGTGHGQGVTGFIAKSDYPFDPVVQGYPPSNPTTGFEPKNESFAGIIFGTPTGGGANLSLYCIDINTLTYGGIGYVLGTWDNTTVPNVDYVARLLTEYYPNSGEPAALTDLNQKAAAVQAAIWFFTDKYVLNTSDPLHGTVAGIVDHIIKAGPLKEQPPPSLTITPPQLSGPAGSVLGPFTVNTNTGGRLRSGPPATVNATGGRMFSDSAGTNQIADGASVPDGQRIWVRSTGPSEVVLEATAEATVPTGNVYVYDGNTGGVNDAQHLILAKTGILKTTVHATAEFLRPGSLVVKKTIAGPAAGSQGKVVIHTVCNGEALNPDFVIAAGTPAGDKSQTYAPIPAGSLCNVTETSDGSVVGTDVVVIGAGQEATIPPGNPVTVHITDTYRFVGSLLVRKTIAGPGAGQQGEIRIHTVCDGKALTPDFVIPAGTPAGDQTKQYDQIEVPAKCTVTETADGHTSTVPVVVDGSGQTASVPPGDIVEVNISNSYAAAFGAASGIEAASSGSLLISKTITGPLAGRQGPVTIGVACNGTALSPDFVIAARARAGRVSRSFDGIPAGSVCTVTETADGTTEDVRVQVIGNHRTVTVPGGKVVPVNLINVYRATPGTLKVTKTIAGSAARRHGRIAILVACGGPLRTFAFHIGAHTVAGSVSRYFPDLRARSRCVVTETVDGHTHAVAVAARSHRTVTIRANRSVTAHLIDRFSAATVPQFTG